MDLLSVYRIAGSIVGLPQKIFGLPLEVEDKPGLFALANADILPLKFSVEKTLASS